MSKVDASLFLRICGAALLLAVSGAILGEISQRARLPVRLSGTVVLYGGVLLLLLPLLVRLGDMTEGYGIAPYVELLLRCLGVALLAQIVSDLCRDVGESGLSSLVEMAAKALILFSLLPTLETLLAAVEGLLST